MNAMEVGTKLVAMVREGRNMDAINEFYAEDVVSIEAMAGPGMDREAKGIDAVRGKNAWWVENHEMHGTTVEGPFPHGEDRFCMYYTMDVTNKPTSQRMEMKEVGLYSVQDGKIVKEEFFYSM